MRKFLPFLVMLLVLQVQAATVWGKKGHRVTGYIAEKHLTRKAKKAIDQLLNGHSLAFVSTYADEIKSDRKYSKYSAWHYVNYPMGSTYAEAEKSEYGDLVMGIAHCRQILTDPLSSEADKVFYLQMLVHFIGDLHQPMHAGLEEDKGGNDIQVQWFNEGSNLHRVWDTNLIESYGMSFYELGDELNSTIQRKQIKVLQQGSVVEWLEESHQLAAELYDSVEVGEKLRYSYSYKYNDLMMQQLRLGGLRLARVLNEIFG